MPYKKCQQLKQHANWFHHSLFTVARPLVFFFLCYRSWCQLRREKGYQLRKVKLREER